MNIVLRLVAASGFAALTLTAPVMAQGVDSFSLPTTTGSYLAGQQAMSELRTNDAAQFFRDALSTNFDDVEILQRAFIAYATNGDIEQAANAAQHLLETEPGNDLAHIVIATVAMKQRRYDAAIQELSNPGEDSFEGVTAAILRAWALTADNRIDEGFEMLSHIGGGGLNGFLMFHRAIMDDVAGRSDAALDLAKQAYDSDKYSPDIVEAYSRMLGNAGRFDDALAVINNYEAAGLDHPLVKVVKEALEKKQRPGLYADSIQAGTAEMFHAVGVAYARESASESGLVFLRLGQYLDSRSDLIPLVIGQLYDTAGQHEAANEIYNAVPADSPLKSMAVVRVADNLDALGDRPEALRQLGNIVVADPTDLDAILVLGDLLRTDKQYDKAAEAYTKALAISGGNQPSDWRYYYYRGISYERNKQWPLAEADFKKALALNPGQPQVLNYLGYSWVDKGMNLAEGLDLIQQAVDAAPNDGYITDSLGWAFYKLGRYPEAVEKLEQAAVLLSTDPTINDHLGDAYWMVGRKLEAKFQWNIAISVDEDKEITERAQAKLKDGLDAVQPATTAATDEPAASAPAVN